MSLVKRIGRIRSILEAEGLDAALVTNPSNVFYLSGHDGGEASLLISADRLALFTDSRYTIQAAAQAPLYEQRIFAKSMTEELAAYLAETKARRVGFEASHLSFERFEECRKAFALDELRPLDKPMTGFRAIKDDGEIALMRESVRIADLAFDHIRTFIRPGMTELEIAAELEYFMIRNGASGNSFPPIVAAGERSAMPHAAPTERKALAGEWIKLDFGCRYRNYCSDTTRMVFLGEPEERIRKIYDAVLTAQTAAVKTAKAGLSVKDLDLTARAILDELGYGGKFLHGLGHGVGIDIHEHPHVSWKQEVLLEEGMAVTIEPGVYIEGYGGVRIEDIVVIGKDGCEVLTKAPKELAVV
jgi:Xaa-Pro aminopeptidase